MRGRDRVGCPPDGNVGRHPALFKGLTITDTERDNAPRPARDFEAAYASTPPWDIGRPQAVFAELAAKGGMRGRVLDAGCGTGEHALLAASLGLEATGLDAAPTAIALAERKAGERGMSVRFIVGDVLDLPSLGMAFDTVLDCGLFHVFDDDERARYVESLSAVVPAGGRYHMLCFSDRQPGDWGPRRVHREEIIRSFSSGWRVDSIEPATLEVTFDVGDVSAWMVGATRVES